jgi:hypothetical protein
MAKCVILNMRVKCVAILLLFAFALAGAEPDARRLYQEGQKAEKAGDLTRAYILYSQAVAFAPYNPEYFRRRELMRVASKLGPADSSAEKAISAPEVRIPQAAREALPPPELKAKPGRMDLDLNGDPRSLFIQVARSYDLESAFDPDYQSGGSVRLHLDSVDYREAIRALEAATGSFVVPLSERRLLVARDTPQKRSELEPVVSLEIPVSIAVSTQQAQEMVRGIQQVLGLVRVAYDASGSTILVRDRLSRVRAAQEMIRRLVQRPAFVALEIEFLEAARTDSSRYGVSFPSLFPLSNLGGVWNSLASPAAGFTKFLAFGGGQTLFGIGLADAQAFASASRSSGHSLFRAEVRSIDGQKASLHIGDRYPILTGKFVNTGSDDDQFTFPPSVNFEELGLVVEITPRVSGSGDVNLALNVEFKALTGQVVDELPVIANRKLVTEVKLRNGEWAILAGLMNSSQARTISGLAGFSRVPIIGHLFRRTTQDRTSDELLIILRPVVLVPPPTEAAAWIVGLGSEPRPRIPL